MTGTRAGTRVEATGGALPSGLPLFPGLAGSPDGWALFLDLDGTLLDIAPRPEAVVVTDDLLPSLVRLTNLLGGAVAVVTGRRLHDIDDLLGPLPVPVAGLHGAAIRIDGELLAAEGAADIPAALSEALLDFVRPRPGLLLEPKGASVAVHFRNAPERAAEVESEVFRLVGILAPGHDVQPGKMVFEIKPRGVDKGVAVAKLMQTPRFSGRRAAVFGDDLTDEAAFAVVRAKGGVATIVGDPPRPTVAEFRLPNPASLRAWLAAAFTDRDTDGGAAEQPV